VPGVIEWPAKLKGGRAIDAAISTDDLLPTIVAATGAALPKDRPLDGENVLPLLEGASAARSGPLYFRSLLRQNSSGWEAGEGKQSAIMDGKWKLISVDNDRTFALYDLDQDPRETTDLAAKEPKRVEQMKKLLADRLASFASSAKGDDYRSNNPATTPREGS